ncbi:phospho-N-acetylmuramoyl-pentapeptide-transferase [Candidatus Gottesmanbacteria bacterium]|nr:phospho-N-acetylmuramoyl-pentapeptide-transferase [Candidatus Gottesmanbacteria bacterium]
MSLILSLLLASFFINGILLIPFIHIVYKMKFERQKQKTKDAFNIPTPIFDALHKLKAGTPLGGGLLLVITTTFLFFLSFPILYYFWIPITSVYTNIGSEIKILIFTFISFSFIGLYDDIKKVFFGTGEKFFGMRLRHKLILEVILASVAAFWLYSELKIDIIHIPFLGVVNLGIFYIPFAAFVIVSFANAYNITDGLDGLASGVLFIALCAFWVISHAILDTPIALFIAAWLGGLIAFLYFNVYPARIFLGDVGALSFGATFAIIGLLLGKVFSLIIIGGFFVIEVTSSFLQLVSKKYRGKKLMRVAPFHLWLQERGWLESTVVFRAWLASIVLSLLGLWLAFLS